MASPVSGPGEKAHRGSSFADTDRGCWSF